MSSTFEKIGGNTEAAVRMAEKDLGITLRGDAYVRNASLLTPQEIAQRLCVESPKYISGPFSGFHRVLRKDLSSPQDKQQFMNRTALMDGYMLLMPTAKGGIRRVLVKSEGTEARLTVFGEDTRFKSSRAEKTVFSGVLGFDDAKIGSHSTGALISEPGHLALTNAVVLGGYATNDIHRSLHGDFESVGKNILASTNRSAVTSQLGVQLTTATYSYDSWPKSLELLWHPDDGKPETATQEQAVTAVQALGFVSVREQGKVSEVMRIVGAMA